MAPAPNGAYLVTGGADFQVMRHAAALLLLSMQENKSGCENSSKQQHQAVKGIFCVLAFAAASSCQEHRIHLQPTKNSRGWYPPLSCPALPHRSSPGRPQETYCQQAATTTQPSSVWL